MHCIGYNDNGNVVIRHYNKKLKVYNENILLNMLILKVKLKANINLAFKNSENIDKQLHLILIKSRLSDMHYPLTDIQADFELNRLVR